MSILTDAQKSQLFGRLLGIQSQPAGASVPDRSPPSGTVAGTEPVNVARNFASSQTALVIGGLVAVLGLVYVARKVF